MARALVHSRRITAHSAFLTLAAGLGTIFEARASTPFEYPDNGAAAFSRGGAWLATANEPLTAHYNPAALATIPSSASVDTLLNLNRVCYDRRGPDGQPEGPASGYEYLPVCNERSGFPSTIPSLAVAWRAAPRLGIGFAVVPPAAYGVPRRSFPKTALGYNRALDECLARGLGPDVCGGDDPYQPVPAPYRYQVLDQLTTILFPTLAVGYEPFDGVRIGAGFIAGMATIVTHLASVSQEMRGTTGDHAAEDTFATLRTRDLFIPGAVVSVHWSPARTIDVAAWARYVDAVRSSSGELEVVTQAYDSRTLEPRPVCLASDPACDVTGAENAVANRVGDEAFRRFSFRYPPEARIGVRFHLPRDFSGAPPSTRDPLKDDVFDLELDGTYAHNRYANTTEVRFAEQNGQGLVPLTPTGYVPPNSDRYNGFRDSFGVRFGGQVNIVPDKIGLRAGTWLESRSLDPEWLQVGFIGATRGGFGGGVVLRQDFIDLSFGYQRHWSLGLDNGGRGAMRAVVGDNSFNLNDEPPDVSAADRTQFRTYHVVNNGRVTQSAHAFTLGATMRF